MVKPAADDGLRVIVGDPSGGPRSILWRVWTGRRNSDVYISARPIAGELKVSLHESGIWRYAFTQRHQLGPRPLIGMDEDRAKFKWNRPAEHFPGATRAFVLSVPASELMEPARPDPLKKPATRIPVPPPGTQVEIDLWLARQHVPDSWPGKRAMGTACLYRRRLPNGEELIVTQYVAPMDEERVRNIERAKDMMLKGLRAAIAAGASEVVGAHDVRGLLLSSPGPTSPPDLRGVHVFTDVAFPRWLIEAA
jgi:hypothetical protein